MYKVKDFSEDISKIANQNSKNSRSLEVYLRALWSAALDHQDKTVSHRLLLQILKEAFVREPAAIEMEWLNLTEMPDWNYRDDRYVIEAFEDGKVIILEDNVDDFEIFRRAIQFQIADLSRFDEDVFSDPNSYYGVDSTTGNRWYNVHVHQYLHCAASFMTDGSRGGDIPLEQVDWVDLAWILKAGMSYE